MGPLSEGEFLANVIIRCAELYLDTERLNVVEGIVVDTAGNPAPMGLQYDKAVLSYRAL